MKRTTYQVPELRDENDNIIQDGTFGKHSAFSNATNDGAFDYILNNLEALRDNINGSRIYVKNKDALTTPGDISAMYIAEDTGKWYLWDGTKYIETDNARKIADEAIAARDVAKTSEQNAKTSEQNAKTSESNAATSKQAAVLAAVAAANSAKVAATSEANAKTSETHAASSETNAASYLAQAKTIKEDVDSALGKITGAMKYAGSVNAYADLPTANRNPGDVYNVKTADAAHGIKAGENVAWNGTDWDPLGGTVDLSPYATNTSVAGAFMNVTYSNATLNFIKKDGSTVSAIVNNVAHATTADSATSATSAASATKATADANGNNIVNTYVTKSDLSSSVSTTSLTVSGETSVPTANAGNSSKAIANTEFVQGELTNYLPLRGGTLTGAINTANFTWNKLGDNASFGDHNIGGKMCVKSQTFRNTGIAFFNQSDTNVGEVDVNNAFNFNKPVKENGGFLVPIGVVQAFAGSTIPTGWLLCDGSAVSRTDYAALFAVIGTTYGAGFVDEDGNISMPDYNGSTTFNLPNLVDKFVEGSATAGTVKSAGLPNITGSTAWAVNGTLGTYSSQGTPYHRNAGALSVETDGKAFGAIGSQGNDSKNSNVSVNIDASRSSAIYGNSTTVQPPALTMRYIIKY